MAEPQFKKILLLFDVDGTLSLPRQEISKALDDYLQKDLKKLVHIGIVGGSDFKKIAEQMGGSNMIKKFSYVFAENGLIYFRHGQEQETQSIQKFLGEEKLQAFINYCLQYLSTVELPFKRGTFIEFRNGMLNVSPVGRSCTISERNAFENYDKQHKIRQKMIENLREKFPDNGLTYSIGGQISFDVFPVGWDKTYCLGHLEKEGFEQIHFFGDKTDKGGNDYEIYNDSRVIGHKVTGPDDTMEQLKKLINELTTE